MVQETATEVSKGESSIAGTMGGGEGGGLKIIIITKKIRDTV